MTILAIRAYSQIEYPEYLEHVNPDLALIDYEQIRGTHWYVADVAARDAIPIDKRMVGMLITYFDGANYVTSRYGNSSVTNVNWVNTANWKLLAIADDINSDIFQYVQDSGLVDRTELYDSLQNRINKLYIGGQDEFVFNEDTIYKVDTANIALNAINSIDSFFVSGQNEWIKDNDTIFKVDTSLYTENVIITVLNNSGSLINHGMAVYIDTSSNGVPEIMLANNKYYDKSRLIGFVIGGINDSNIGKVLLSGVLDNINLSGCVNGNPLYLSSTDGLVTSVKPSGGEFPVRVGFALNCLVNGSMLVSIMSPEYTDEAIKQTGFPTYQDTYNTMSFDTTNRQFKIMPVSDDFYYYQSGIKYFSEGDSTIITDENGLHLIYFDTTSLNSLYAPTRSQVAEIIINKVMVSYIYLDTASNNIIYFANERHQQTWPSSLHLYGHFYIGARYGSGIGLTDLITDGAGTIDADAQFGVSSGDIGDEDIPTFTPSIVSTTGLPIYYFDGANADLKMVPEPGFSFLTDVTAGVGVTGRVVYNEWTGTVWQLTAVASGDFVNCHIFAINAYTDSMKVISIVGQGDYGTLAAAQTAQEEEISNLQTGMLPLEELVPIASVIAQTGNTYANAIKSRIRPSIDAFGNTVDYADWRTSPIGAGGGSSGTATTFIDLTDVPASYTGNAGGFITVNAAESGLNFVSFSDSADNYTSVNQLVNRDELSDSVSTKVKYTDSLTTYITPAQLTDSIQGKVDTSGLPVTNQIAVFSAPNKIGGDVDFSWDGNSFNINSGGVEDIRIGYQSALNASNIGSNHFNVNIGYQSAYGISDGTHNVIIGDQSAYNGSTNTDNNVFLGYRSAYNTNTATGNVIIGNEAGYNINAGANSVIIGNEAGYNTNTSNSVIIGNEAGYSLGLNDNNNVMIGNQAGYNETGSYKLYIDNSNTVNPLIYGDFSADSLEINGDLNITGNITLSGETITQWSDIGGGGGDSSSLTYTLNILESLNGDSILINSKPKTPLSYIPVADNDLTDKSYVDDLFTGTFETVARTIYISEWPVGNDTTGDGTISTPFNSILKGVEDIKSNISNVAITLQLDTGHYDFSEDTRDEINKITLSGSALINILGTRVDLYTGLTITQTDSDPSLIDVAENNITTTSERIFFTRTGNDAAFWPINEVITTGRVEAAYFVFSSLWNNISEMRTVLVNSDNSTGMLNLSLKGGGGNGNGDLVFRNLTIESDVTLDVVNTTKFDLRGVCFDLSGGSTTRLQFSPDDPAYMNGVKVLTNSTNRAGLSFLQDYKTFLYATSVKNVNASISSLGGISFAKRGATISGVLCDNFDAAINLAVTEMACNGKWIKAKDCNQVIEVDKDYYTANFIAQAGSELVLENTDYIFKLDVEQSIRIGRFNIIGTPNTSVFSPSGNVTRYSNVLKNQFIDIDLYDVRSSYEMDSLSHVFTISNDSLLVIHPDSTVIYKDLLLKDSIELAGLKIGQWSDIGGGDSYNRDSVYQYVQDSSLVNRDELSDSVQAAISTSNTYADALNDSASVTYSTDSIGGLTSDTVYHTDRVEFKSSVHVNRLQETFSASKTIDFRDAYEITYKLTGNSTVTFQGMRAGDNNRLLVKQDATGSRTLTISGTTTEGEVVTQAASTNDLETNANHEDLIQFEFNYDADTIYYYVTPLN